MERIISTSRAKNANVFADPSHRMSRRPLAVKSGEGRGFEDFGSSLAPPKHTANHKTSPKGKLKPVVTITSKPRKAPLPISEDESDDELLLSSQGSESIHATSSTKRVAKGNKPDLPRNGEETVHVGGRELAAHPDFKPSSLNLIKRLRFSKNKEPTPPGDDPVELPPPSSLPDSQDLFKPISDDIEVVSDSRPYDLSSSHRKPAETFATRRGSPGATHAVTSRSPDTKKSSTSKLSPTTANDTPPKSRPRPRVVIKSSRDSTESTPRPNQSLRDIPLRSKAAEQHTNGDKNSTAKKPPPARRELQAFPMLLDAKGDVLDGGASPSKTKKVLVSRGPKPIPLPSPLKTKPIPRDHTFPNLSPLSSSIDKGKARAMTSDEDDEDLSDGLRKRTGPKPFPMSSQMLAGINRRSKSPSVYSYRSAKRASSDDSSNEQGRILKKRKDSRSGVLDTFDYLCEPMQDDSIDLGRARDPSKVCPYCDEDLPSHPTPHFQHLLTTASKKSVLDPRPRNRGGLRAPLTVYISVCQRHRFESHQLPIATAKGWPKKIDFAKVPARVKKMKNALEAIILDKDDISDVEDLDHDDGSRGPRSKSMFWREFKKEVKKQGIRTVVGVKGQFASFDKAQPGYYGEQGSVIIYQTLFDLFPPSAFDPSLIAPLAPAEFIQRILLPEVAVRLIAEDLGVDIQKAVVTLRESAQYGVAMFPDTNEQRVNGAGCDEDEEMGVADRIVMERARARRKELAEQEKVEEAILEKEHAAQRARAREDRRQKALERAQQAKKIKARADTTEDASDVSKGVGRGARRAGQATTNDSESDAMSVDSATSRRSARVAKKGRQTGNKVIRTKPERDSSDSDSMEVVGDRGYKPRSMKNKTRERTPDPDIQMRTEAIVARKSFSKFAALNHDGEHEITPRPTRERKVDMTTAETAGGSGHILPLQIVRNRQTSTHDGWSRSLRTDMPEDTDSDASGQSQRLVRAPIRKGASEHPYRWLFSSSPSESP